MATQFSGGTIVNTTFQYTYEPQLMIGLLSGLTTAGWTSIQLGIGTSTAQGPGNASVVTLTLASPGVVNWTGHGFIGGEKIMFMANTNTTGALPTGISVDTVYYVKYINANTFNIATSLGGSNVNFTGSQSGTIWCYTQTLLMQSALQANVSNPIVVRIQNNTGITGIQITIQNSAATLVGTNDQVHGATLMPFTFANFQLIATRYHFVCFLQGTTSYNRCWVHAGMVYVPSFLTGIYDHGFVLSDTLQSENGSYCNNFRNTTQINVNNTCNSQHIWNQNFCDNSNNNNGQVSSGTPTVIMLQPAYTQINQTSTVRWANDYYNTSDMLLSWGPNTIGLEGKIRSQFFDMVYIPEAFALDATDTFNGHSWQNLTNNQQSNPRGGVWMATN